METTAAFDGLRCLACGRTHDHTVSICPVCTGSLVSVYDATALSEYSPGRSPPTPIPEPELPTLGAGGTPLIELPGEFGDGASVLLKTEGQTGTGSVRDREMRLAVGLARALGSQTSALPSTGNGAQSAAAYAARAGLDLEAFVPSRTMFTNKAMINAHGAELTVVGGRYPDAYEAFTEAADTHSGSGETAREEQSAAPDESAGWYSLAPFETPYRHDGARAIAYELYAELGEVPDRVLVPTGHGTTLVGLHRGFRELAAAGAAATVPRLYAAQAAGCAPLAEATDEPASVEHPDTICDPLEVPDPRGGRHVLAAVEATDGRVLAIADEQLLATATGLTDRGVPISATGGAALAGLGELAVESDETVVVIDPVSVDREADLLRSHLMSKGR